MAIPATWRVVPMQGCRDGMIDYTDTTGAYVPAGGMCLEDYGGLPTMGGVPVINMVGSGGGWVPAGPVLPTAPGGGGSSPTGFNTWEPTLQLAGGGQTGQPYSIGCDSLPDWWQRELCKLGKAGVDYLSNRGGGGTQLAACPTGYEPNPNASQPGQPACVIKGAGRYLPGDVGRPDYAWTPTNGRYGAGVTPVLVQSSKRACPSGFVLGKDGVCYDHLPRTQRAHNPGAKPMLTGGDMNALRRAHTLKKTINKLARRHGTKPARACAPRRKK